MGDRETARLMGCCCVTGMARSGTTFVDDRLALSWRTLCSHEPFPPPGVIGVDWNRTNLVGNFFEAVGEPAKLTIDDFLRLRGRHGNQVPLEDPFLRRTVKQVVGGRERFGWRVARCVASIVIRGAVTDPFAWCHSPWLHHVHDVKIVVLVKQSVSQVASYARAGLRDYVAAIERRRALRAELRPGDRSSPIDANCSNTVAAARQWRWQCRLLGQWADRFGRSIVRIEDLADHPQTRFPELFRSLAWSAPERLSREVAKRTGGGNPAEARPGRFQDLNRDSRAIFAMRRASLPADPRRIVYYEETFDVARAWYDESSYDLDDQN